MSCIQYNSECTGSEVQLKVDSINGWEAEEEQDKEEWDRWEKRPHS